MKSQSLSLVYLVTEFPVSPVLTRTAPVVASIDRGITQDEVQATPAAAAAAAAIPGPDPVAPTPAVLVLLARPILTAAVQAATVPAAVRTIPAEDRAPVVPVRPVHLLPGVRAVRLVAAVAPTESTNFPLKKIPAHPESASPIRAGNLS